MQDGPGVCRPVSSLSVWDSFIAQAASGGYTRFLPSMEDPDRLAETSVTEPELSMWET
jgi:hypothetical protein